MITLYRNNLSNDMHDKNSKVPGNKAEAFWGLELGGCLDIGAWNLELSYG